MRHPTLKFLHHFAPEINSCLVREPEERSFHTLILAQTIDFSEFGTTWSDAAFLRVG